MEPRLSETLDLVMLATRRIERVRRIARVVIESGNACLASTNNDGVNSVDVVAMEITETSNDPDAPSAKPCPCIAIDTT